MLLLVLGVALWWGAHLFKRYPAPELHRKLGQGEKGIVTGLLVLSVLLMIVGYRMADGAFFWGPSAALKGINNLLLLVAVYLFAASGMKTRITHYMRHPQLIGFSLWAVGHILVNGDVPSFVLFGGLLAWALVEIVVINRDAPDWTPPAKPLSAGREAGAAIGALVVFILIGLVHTWLGYNPFGA